MGSVDGLFYSAKWNNYIMQGRGMDGSSLTKMLSQDLTTSGPMLVDGPCASGDIDDIRDMLLCPSTSAAISIYRLVANMNACPTTCGNIKAAYKSSRCCNNPSNIFSFPGRRLGGDRDVEGLVDEVRLAMQRAKLQGRMKSELLAMQFKKAVDL
jgi:hypothetical protein